MLALNQLYNHSALKPLSFIICFAMFKLFDVANFFAYVLDTLLYLPSTLTILSWFVHFEMLFYSCVLMHFKHDAVKLKLILIIIINITKQRKKHLV